MIRVNDDISINENDLKFRFIRASGPGGQNVNKVASAVQLSFDVEKSRALTPAVKERLRRSAGKRINKNGILIIEAKRFRDQERNRSDAIKRLVKLIADAAKKPKSRIKTKPTKASREKRLRSKKEKSIKKSRRKRPEMDID